MTEIPETLRLHLEQEVTTLCHCWRLTRRDGAVFGFTDHDRTLICDGTSFAPETGLSASEAKSSLDLSVDTVDVEGALSSLDIAEEDIAAGLYDGASIETLLVDWARPQDFASIRTAVAGKIERHDGRFVAELESLSQSLDQPNGRIIRRKCDAELGDGRCGFDLARTGFHATGTVLSAERGGLLRVDGIDAFAPGWFANGLINWTSGEKAGRKERIIDHRVDGEGAGLVLWSDGQARPEPGDQFSLVAGCDKRFATCREKFSNAVNFRGFPHLPGNDAAYGYVVDGDVFDGGPIVE